MKAKRIRDPLYGYIEVEEKYVPLIDCAAFQRLRHIKQTGYQALFPSADHTRFTHSLGVFHLGKQAIDYFFKNIDLDSFGIDDNQWEKLKETFVLACLLHDVGHSPFSHTGESYYDRGIVFARELPELIQFKSQEDKERFITEIGTQGTGKPHEAMSAIIGIELCREHKMEIDEDLFARSIIGTQYRGQGKTEKEKRKPLPVIDVLKNAIITLLNGNLIDVDKLDYVVRDAFVTGFNTMQIDMERLLSSYTITKDNKGYLTVAYKKGAISVIENVIYANDLERRWVQTHPVILYDCNLTDFAIREFDNMARDRYTPVPQTLEDPITTLPTVFLKDSLSANGISSQNHRLRLLCDDDIISYVKNSNSMVANQLFARDARYKPMWKTAIDFEDIADKILGTDTLSKFQEDLQAMLNFIDMHTQFFINEETINRIEKVKNNAKTVFKLLNLGEEDIGIALTTYKQVLWLCKFFRNFKETYNLPDFEFAAIVSPKFQSAYKKLEAEDIKIEIGNCKVIPFGAAVPVRSKDVIRLNTSQSLFYIYTTKANLEACADIATKFFEHIKRAYPFNPHYNRF